MSDITPIGKYPAKAVRVPDENGTPRLVQWAKSQKGNTTMLIHMEIQEPEDLRGRIHPWFATWTENTQDRIIESLGYLGMKGDDLAKLEEEKLDEVVQIVIEHEERERKEPKPGEPKTYTQAKIAWVNRLSSGTVTLQNPMSTQDVAIFAATMKATLRGKRAGQQQRLPAQKPAGNSGGGHPNAPGSSYGAPPKDDLPFVTVELGADDANRRWSRWP